MGLMVAYLLLAVAFLVLAAGWYTPKTWRELPERHIKLVKAGCLFVSLLMVYGIVRKFLAGE